MALGDVNSSERGSGARYNDGKVALELIPLMSLEDCARVFDYGRRKYASWNWAKGMPWDAPLACLLRHLSAWQRGEDNDPESGLPHLGHAMCNLVMLSTYAKTYPEGDNRPKDWLNMPAGKALDSVSMDAPATAFQPTPVPHSLAEAMQRDGVVPAPTIEPLPPNCEGHHAVEAPMPPHLAERLDGQDDDEGESVPGYPPGVSCNVTGECE